MKIGNIINVDNFTLLKIEKKEEIKTNNALIIRGITIKLLENIKYSQIDENNFVFINNNDYERSGFTLEIIFNNILDNPYINFFVNCFTIKIDNEFKIIGNNIYCDDVVTKINKNGNIVIGIGYFFKNQEEYEKIKNCNSIMIEGYIAFEKTKNIYGILCNVINEENKWNIEEANTYRNIVKEDIKSILY